jgi:hypothetical protein
VLVLVLALNLKRLVWTSNQTKTQLNHHSRYLIQTQEGFRCFAAIHCKMH